MANDPVVILSAVRTPMGGFQGELSEISAPELGAQAIKAAVKIAHAGPTDIQELLMGCVLPAGLGQAPARQAALGAGLPYEVGCTTINKMCGSGMKAIMLAHDLLVAGSHDMMVAGGFESMTNAPYLLPKVRAGLRLGHAEVIDHMFFDGLQDAYNKDANGQGKLMGVFAEVTAEKYNFSRQAQDEFAITSLERAQQATAKGWYKDEIVNVIVKTRKGDKEVSIDEGPQTAKIDKIAQLKPAFKKDGTVTAANSSSISDGAAALVLMRESLAQRRGFKPLARIVGQATHSQEPQWFTTAPVGAIKTLMQRTGWDIADVDLFEINEAFAVVTMAAMHDLGLSPEKVNIHGGACALGHPIGASGARIVVTLIHALRRIGKKRGVAALCIGGGEATAMAIELI